MNQYKTIADFTVIQRMLAVCFISIGLFACGSTPESEPGAEIMQSSEPPPAPEGSPAETATGTDQGAAAPTASAEASPAVKPEVITPPRIVESCKDEPYSKYEKQSRESIQKGLEATKAEKFGVGFRSVAEHNKWSKIHSSLFKSVNDACGALSECAKKHKKNKDTKCVKQAKEFSQWQKLAKSFTAKAKTAETTQPPKLCSQPPSLDDPARCFHSLGDNIDKVCNTDECKEVSDCWRGVGFLDAAIIQARTSCGFVHEKLETCRGFTEATQRRKNKFAQCQDLQGRLNITVYPVL